VTRLNTTLSDFPFGYVSNSSQLKQSPATNEVALLEGADMAVIVNDDVDAQDAVEAVIDMTLKSGGQAVDQELVVIEVSLDEPVNQVENNAQDSGKSMFIVLWGEVVEKITYLETTDITESDPGLTSLTDQPMQVLPAIISAESYQLDRLTNAANKRRSIAAWIATAGITRQAWSSLDRFFLDKQENN